MSSGYMRYWTKNPKCYSGRVQTHPHPPIELPDAEAVGIPGLALQAGGRQKDLETGLRPVLERLLGIRIAEQPLLDRRHVANESRLQRPNPRVIFQDERVEDIGDGDVAVLVCEGCRAPQHHLGDRSSTAQAFGDPRSRQIVADTVDEVRGLPSRYPNPHHAACPALSNLAAQRVRAAEN